MVVCSSQWFDPLLCIMCRMHLKLFFPLLFMVTVPKEITIDLIRFPLFTHSLSGPDKLIISRFELKNELNLNCFSKKMNVKFKVGCEITVCHNRGKRRELPTHLFLFCEQS